MEQKPSSQVSECVRKKPRLLVFDDDVEQLASYCAKFSKYYDVEGVLVSDCNKTDATLEPVRLSGNWAKVAQDYRLDPAVFDCVRHVVFNQDELRTLLKERKPEYVLSDFQMRPIQGPISGIDVMHAVAELLPDTARAIHTGSGCAQPIPVSKLGKYEFEDRMKLVKAMTTDSFKIFTKSPYHKHFDPQPVETYFAEAATSRTPT